MFMLLMAVFLIVVIVLLLLRMSVMFFVVAVVIFLWLIGEVAFSFDGVDPGGGGGGLVEVEELGVEYLVKVDVAVVAL